MFSFLCRGIVTLVRFSFFLKGDYFCNFKVSFLYTNLTKFLRKRSALEWKILFLHQITRKAKTLRVASPANEFIPLTMMKYSSLQIDWVLLRQTYQEIIVSSPCHNMLERFFFIGSPIPVNLYCLLFAKYCSVHNFLISSLFNLEKKKKKTTNKGSPSTKTFLKGQWMVIQNMIILLWKCICPIHGGYLEKNGWGK